MRAGVQRVVGYARVSSEEQAKGTSLQDQQNALRAYAKARGLDVERFYVESESAVYEKIERRDQIRALLSDLRAGDLVLCDKIDRWSRDPIFTLQSVKDILAAGASFYAVADACDPSTRDGDSMLGFRAIMAKEEHKRIRERTVGTRKILRDQGYYVEGLPPLGYRRPKGGKDRLSKNVLEIVPADAELVRDLYSRCIRGESIGDIQRYLTTARRGRTWDKKLINTILRNRTYRGEVKATDGTWIKGQHEPIVTAALHQKAGAALKSRQKGGAKLQATSHTRTWLLREVAVCAACGAKISASYGAPKSGSGAKYSYYYSCSAKCGARYIPVEPTDEAASTLITERLVELREHLARESEAPQRTKALDFKAARERLQARRARLFDAYSDPDVGMTKADLRAAVSELDAKLGDLAVKEADAARVDPLSLPAVRRDTLKHVEQVAKAWRGLAAEGRRAVVRELVHEVRLAREAPPKFKWKSAEEIAADVSL